MPRQFKIQCIPEIIKKNEVRWDTYFEVRDTQLNCHFLTQIDHCAEYLTNHSRQYLEYKAPFGLAFCKTCTLSLGHYNEGRFYTFSAFRLAILEIEWERRGDLWPSNLHDNAYATSSLGVLEEDDPILKNMFSSGASKSLVHCRGTMSDFHDFGLT